MEEKIKDIDQRLTALENMHNVAFFIIIVLGVGFIYKKFKDA